MTVSFGELNTFRGCNLQHFYRYYMKMRGDDYVNSRALHVGSTYHNVVEGIEKGGKFEEPLEEVIRGYIELEKSKLLSRFTGNKTPDEYDLEIDMLLAECMVKVYLEEIERRSEYESLEQEFFFEEEFGDHTLIGAIDSIWLHRNDLDGRSYVMPGDFKTWANSRSVTKLDEYVLDDLQTDLYLAVLQKRIARDPFFLGIDWVKEDPIITDKVYTVVRKPPSNIIKRKNYRSLEENKRGIIDWYQKTNSSHKEVRVTSRHGEGTHLEMEKFIEEVAQEIDAFYKDPYGALENFLRPGAYDVPCIFCEFKGPCREGEFPATYSYKINRTINKRKSG